MSNLGSCTTRSFEGFRLDLSLPRRLQGSVHLKVEHELISGMALCKLSCLGALILTTWRLARRKRLVPHTLIAFLKQNLELLGVYLWADYIDSDLQPIAALRTPTGSFVLRAHTLDTRPSLQVHVLSTSPCAPAHNLPRRIRASPDIGLSVPCPRAISALEQNPEAALAHCRFSLALRQPAFP